eukprot:scaffold141689_cov38-Prasinocladus_malaysianus.AAC.1
MRTKVPHRSTLCNLPCGTKAAVCLARQQAPSMVWEKEKRPLKMAPEGLSRIFRNGPSRPELDGCSDAHEDLLMHLYEQWRCGGMFIMGALRHI